MLNGSVHTSILLADIMILEASGASSTRLTPPCQSRMSDMAILKSLTQLCGG